MTVGDSPALEGSSEVVRVYYVMVLRDLLPLAVGCHYLRPPTEAVEEENLFADGAPPMLDGLECWLVQAQHEGTGQEGALAAMGEVATSFMERGGVFGTLLPVI